MNVYVSRSPWRLLAYALLAVPAILLAVDMTISYRWIRAPETTQVAVGQTTNEAGELVDINQDVLTDVGRAERRRDVLFAAALFAGGVAAMGWALKELARPTKLLEADDDGLLIRVDGPRRPPRRFGWERIADLRSGVMEDDGIDVGVFSIRFDDEAELPHLPAGGLAQPPWLHLYTEEWDVPGPQIVALLEHRVIRSQAPPMAPPGDAP